MFERFSWIGAIQFGRYHGEPDCIQAIAVPNDNTSGCCTDNTRRRREIPETDFSEIQSRQFQALCHELHCELHCELHV